MDFAKRLELAQDRYPVKLRECSNCSFFVVAKLKNNSPTLVSKIRELCRTVECSGVKSN